jgi:hypothetical protein
MAVVGLAMLSILRPGEEGGFVAYNCTNASNRVNTDSVLEAVGCPLTTPHAVERTIFERLSRSRASGWYQSTDAR